MAAGIIIQNVKWMLSTSANWKMMSRLESRDRSGEVNDVDMSP